MSVYQVHVFTLNIYMIYKRYLIDDMRYDILSLLGKFQCHILDIVHLRTSRYLLCKPGAKIGLLKGNVDGRPVHGVLYKAYFALLPAERVRFNSISRDLLIVQSFFTFFSANRNCEDYVYVNGKYQSIVTIIIIWDVEMRYIN